MPIRKWKKVSSKIVYKNPWFSVREDIVRKPNGKKGIYGVLDKHQGVFIIAADGGGSIYFIKQHRYPIKKIICELPAGVIKKGEWRKGAAAELFEETGIRAKHFRRLGGFFTGAGHETTYIHAVIATKLDTTQMGIGHQEHDEAINTIVRFTPRQLHAHLQHGTIECGISLAALCLYFETLRGIDE